MKKELTEIICILDRSGSMGSIASDAIGGFNTFLADQKTLDGDANMTLVLFDDQYEVLSENKDIQDVNELTYEVYRPRGTTALHDAIGRTIMETGKRLSNTPEDQRPEKVMVAILTDGMENASREHTASAVKGMIEHQEDKYNWQFMYLAANQDAFDIGKDFGMKDFNSINFNATDKGAKTAFANMSQYSGTVRSATNLSKSTMMSYTALTEDDVN